MKRRFWILLLTPAILLPSFTVRLSPVIMFDPAQLILVAIVGFALNSRIKRIAERVTELENGQPA